MMRVELSNRIEGDLEEIGAYIAKHNPTRAVTFILEMRSAIAELAHNPFIFPLRPEYGRDVRLKVFGNYVIAFRVVGDIVRVRRVVNGYRNLPRLLR